MNDSFRTLPSSYSSQTGSLVNGRTLNYWQTGGHSLMMFSIKFLDGWIELYEHTTKQPFHFYSGNDDNNNGHYYEISLIIKINSRNLI